MNDKLTPTTESRQITVRKLTVDFQSDELSTGRNEEQNIKR